MARNQTLSILNQILQSIQSIQATDVNKEINIIGDDSLSSRLLSDNDDEGNERGGGEERGCERGEEGRETEGGGDVVFRPAGMKKNIINEESKETQDRKECKHSVFNVESLTVGEVMMIAIIVAAIQSNLIPTFQVDYMSIKHQDNAVTITSSSSSSSSEPSLEHSSESKISYPSLTFTDKEKTFQVTFSMVPIFGEMVIYAMKKILVNEKNILSTSNIENKTSGDSNDDNNNIQKTKKKKIQTLYVDPNNFIFKNSDVVKECSEEPSGSEECSVEYAEEYIRQFHSGSLNCMNNKNNKNEKEKKEMKKILNKNKINNCLNSVIIGKYKTKFHELTLRIEKTLLDPLLFENGQSSLSISKISIAVSFSIFTYLKASELCSLGMTCKNLNSDYLNELTWNDLLTRDFFSDPLLVRKSREKLIEESQYFFTQNKELKTTEIQTSKNVNGIMINCVKFNDYKIRKKEQNVIEMRIRKLEKERDMARMRQYEENQITFSPFFLGPPVFQINHPYPSPFHPHLPSQPPFHSPSPSFHPPFHSPSPSYPHPPSHPFSHSSHSSSHPHLSSSSHPFSHPSFNDNSSSISLPHLNTRTPGFFGSKNDPPRHQILTHRYSDQNSIQPSFAYHNNN